MSGNREKLALVVVTFLLNVATIGAPTSTLVAPSSGDRRSISSFWTGAFSFGAKGVGVAKGEKGRLLDCLPKKPRKLNSSTKMPAATKTINKRIRLFIHY